MHSSSGHSRSANMGEHLFASFQRSSLTGTASIIRFCNRPARLMSPSGQADRVDQGGTSIHVRYASKSDQIDASQRTVALCQEPTYAVQQTVTYSITSSALASSAI